MKVKLKELKRRFKVKTCHDVLVGLSLVYRELCATIGKGKHSHIPVKMLFVSSVSSLDLAIMSGRSDAYAFVLNAHIEQGLLK